MRDLQITHCMDYVIEQYQKLDCSQKDQPSFILFFLQPTVENSTTGSALQDSTTRGHTSLTPW